MGSSRDVSWLAYSHHPVKGSKDAAKRPCSELVSLRGDPLGVEG